MKIGDVIRVENWPGTNGKRFRVVKLDENLVHATELGQLNRRSFPALNCHVDRRKTKVEAER